VEVIPNKSNFKICTFNRRENACYHLVQNLVPSSFVSAFYGCGTWSFALRQKHRLRMSGNKVLRKLFGLKRVKAKDDGENCIIRNFIIFAFLPRLLA
jgi:hypothetical protein